MAYPISIDYKEDDIALARFLPKHWAIPGMHCREAFGIHD